MTANCVNPLAQPLSRPAEEEARLYQRHSVLSYTDPGSPESINLQEISV